MNKLKATYNGNSWFSNGVRIYQYIVTGSPKAIAAFLAARAAALNKPEAELPKDEKTGNPYWTRAAFAGVVIKPSYDLAISYGGKIVIDDAKADMARTQQLDELTMVEEAKLLAARKYNRQGNVTAPAAARVDAFSTPLEPNAGAEGGSEGGNQSLQEELETSASSTGLQGSGNEKLDA